MRGQDDDAPLQPGRVSAGAFVRQLRRQAGLSERALARRAACARSTVTRLEHGQLRPRLSLLSALALGLDVDGQGKVLARLRSAAGGDLAPDGRWQHYRWRKLCDGILRGDVPLPSRIAAAMRLHNEADFAWRRATAILARPGALGDLAALEEADRLMARSRDLRAEAGPPFGLWIGGHHLMIGFGPYR
jgi:transcriptional regulator with XRE-family HTH domain